jgi:hypothetical protein
MSPRQQPYVKASLYGCGSCAAAGAGAIEIIPPTLPPDEEPEPPEIPKRAVIYGLGLLAVATVVVVGAAVGVVYLVRRKR